MGTAPEEAMEDQAPTSDIGVDRKTVPVPWFTGGLERLASALEALPLMSRTVLWRCGVLGEDPRAVGASLGLGPDEITALLDRATDGLRLTYLDQAAEDPPLVGDETVAGRVV
ncbi:hypothetical protein J2Y41_003928 [Arthrobacter sp. 1088]|uniref:hypothetical protein n=1 Tax=Arthrobacter sp. 1088 TaxID=2817768 RepID=UPI002858D561|nr:hypothetical protein [Arthrobacter sp. 1088]MDR6688342.1 hypothetical protein [Arthrobacter sp. 1088]